MPNQQPLTIGDIPYPQYLRMTTPGPIKESVAITKGYIYTPDAEGRLIVPVSTSGVADLSNGAFQAADNAPAPADEDTDHVQCLSPGSRIIMVATEGLTVGSEVELESSGSTTTQNGVMAATYPRSKGFLGKIFEILPPTTGGAPVQVTTGGELVVVEFGMS